jgi:hypothetical protein
VAFEVGIGRVSMTYSLRFIYGHDSAPDQGQLRAGPICYGAHIDGLGREKV